MQTNESPWNGMGPEAFRNRLTVGVSAANLDTAIYQDKHSLAQNPVYLAIASQKHCEITPPVCGGTSRETNQSCCKNRVTPRTTRQPNWNHVDRGNLVRHTVDTMMERAVRMTGEKK